MLYITRQNLERAKAVIAGVVESLQTDTGQKVVLQKIQPEAIERAIAGMVVVLTGQNVLPSDSRDTALPGVNNFGLRPEKEANEAR